MGTMILAAHNIYCGYEDKIVLEDISFNIEQGELVGIIGPNGSGKTTLLRALSRILKPGSGTVTLEGNDIWQMRYRDLARNVAVVSQRFQSGWMSVEEFVLMGRIPYFSRFQFIESRHDREIAQKYIELTGIAHLGKKQMEEISGGERQLAQIAKALTQEPKLLLLDEPTSHLDITHQVGMLDLIKRLNRDLGITVVMVLHDLNLAGEYCNKLILINDKSIYRMGRPEEVLTYQAIEDVYKTVVVVDKNPISKKPFVLLVSEEDRE